jgi:hypothetical protein
MFPAMVIVPTLQICWTLFSILSGMLYFQEYQEMGALAAAMFCLGVAVSAAAVAAAAVCFGLLAVRKASISVFTYKCFSGRKQHCCLQHVSG